MIPTLFKNEILIIREQLMVPLGSNGLKEYGFCAWTHFLAFMEWVDEIGIVDLLHIELLPLQSYSCSFCVFYITLYSS